MKHKPYILWGIVAILLVSNLITVYFFNKKDNADSVTASQGTEIVATVGGETISREDWLVAMEESHGQETLRTLINTKVIRSLAKEYNISVSKKEVQQEVDFLKSAYSTLEHGASLNESTLMEEVETELLLEEIVTRDVELSDGELKEYYDENKEIYQIPAMYKLSQIVVSSEEEGEQIVKELEGGSSFEALARERSIEQLSSSQGGEIGYVPLDSFLLTKEAQDAISRLKVDEWTTSVKNGQSQFVVYKVLDQSEGKNYSFEEVKPQIRRQLALRQVEAQVTPEDFWDDLNVDWFYGEQQ